MEIKRINNQTFTSLKNPIPTEIFISELGKITMKEATTKAEITEVAKRIQKQEALIYKIFNCYGHRKDTKEARDFYRSLDKNKWLKDIKDMLYGKLAKPDGKTSFLLVTDENNKTIGLATIESIDGIKNNVGVIEHFDLDYKYRKGNLIHYLLYKITKSGYDLFNSIVTRDASIGYSKQNYFSELGYKQIPKESANTKFLNDKFDGDKYTTWLIKDL